MLLLKIERLLIVIHALRELSPVGSSFSELIHRHAVLLGETVIVFFDGDTSLFHLSLSQ